MFEAITNLDYEVEKERNEMHCGEFNATFSVVKSFAQIKTTIRCGVYKDLNAVTIGKNTFVSDSRCNASCLKVDCDHYLPF